MNRSSVKRTLVRPDGRTYRPRSNRLRIRAWGDDPTGLCGVIVFGTLDPAEALPAAQAACRYWYEGETVRSPSPGWYRDGFDWGERRWIRDERRGAPGVSFTYDSDGG